MEDVLDHNSNEPQQEKERHGCVTAWLVLMIISNSFTAVLYLFASDIITEALPDVTSSNSMLMILGIIGVCNVIFSALLLRWKKIGFWGFLITSIATLIININIGVSVGQSVLGLIGIGLLYGVLQIKKGNKTAWEHLE